VAPCCFETPKYQGTLGTFGGQSMDAEGVIHFGTGLLNGSAFVRRKSIAAIVKAATAGALRALVVDARGPSQAFRAQELLRALFDDPRRPAPVIQPRRVLALIATGDVETAFALGRYGIASVLEERALHELELRVGRILTSDLAPPPLTTPVLAPPRSTHLGPRPELGLPTVTIGYRHAPETLAVLGQYVRALRASAAETTVFEDVATLLEVMVAEGLTCQTNLAAKAGATHTGQFVGSFEFYRALRHTRYGRIPDHPRGVPAMEVFIVVDEVLHETLHLLFLANQVRAGLTLPSARLAEELSLTWWQAVVHNRVYPEWLADRHILEINDDFMLSEANQEPRSFWKVGTVFEQYVGYPWVPYVLARLPARASYIGQRADLAEVIASFASRPEAAFLLPRAAERLSVPVAFDAYPTIPATLRLG
jgi:hypothetical protein